jgi:hypothetical protein
VVVVRARTHTGPHREQICDMLSALGVTPPKPDGWGYGEATGDRIPIPP